ncbi:MAG: hypothetical protein JO241_05050 [Candidatus Eremiobacteraeota bacterium]|nr:hypothetical protein [Candidatus Eremiobacteraeota bacterium]MBV8283741.1 hypothetical protein [Candidatus Eremiobacteraeota bacterium]MBV8583345.1 hypothetical protein [Candidatus Eremiobacteraeota bacterium]
MNRLLRAGIAVAAAIVSTAVPAAAVQTVPFSDEGGLIHVAVSVDRQAPVPMLVDLGAGVNIVSERLAHLVAYTGKYTTMRLTGERLDLPIGKVVSIAIGDVGIGDPTVGVWKGLVAARGVDGLISANAFRDRATTIDFRGKQIVIEDAVSFPERRRTATYVPLFLQDELNYAMGVFARFKFGNGKTGLCEIDTGRSDTVLDNVYAPGGIASIELDGAPQTHVDAPKVKFDNLLYDCMIGNDFWGGRTITLDILNRGLWVQQQL